MGDVATPPSGDADLLQHRLIALQDRDLLFRVAGRAVDGGEEAGGSTSDDDGLGLHWARR